MRTQAVVTGGAGFIGAHLCRSLLAAGWRVRILDPAAPPQDLAAHPDCDHHPGSVTDAAALRNALHGAETVFHLAAHSALWLRRAKAYQEINVEGTRTVLRTALAAGVRRLVHCSTEAALKDWRSDSDSPLREDNAPPLDAMAGPYCRSKWLAEAAVREAVQQGLDAVIVNPTVPVGPGDGQLTPPARMLLDFLNGANPAYLENTFNLVDARDVALGHLRAAEHGVRGGRYLLAGHNLPLSHLLHALHAVSGLPMPRHRVPWPLALAAAWMESGWAQLTGRAPRAPLTGVRLARSSLACDDRLSRAALGLAPRPLHDTLRDTVADFRQRGLLTRAS